VKIVDDINFYFDQQEPKVKEKLQTIRKLIKGRIKNAEDKVIKLPAIQVEIKGKGVLNYGAYKGHISIWSFEKLGNEYVLVEHIKPRFPQYKYTKATIQILTNQPISDEFINEICAFIEN